MTWQLWCAALAVGAVLVGWSEPRTGLRRLRTDGRAAVALRGCWGQVLGGRPGSPPLRSRVWLGVGGGAFVGLLAVEPGAGSVVLAVVAGAVVAVGSGWVWPVPGPDARVGEQLPATLDLLAACLDAGAPMRTAVETVADVSQAETAAVLGRVAGQLRLGRADVDAWRGLAEDHWWGPVARDVARSARSGTSLVGALRVHAADQRRRVAAERTRRARAVGVRSVVPLMACFLPAFVLVGVVPVIGGLLGSFFG